MTKKIVGYDEKGNQVFERDAREYDKSWFTPSFLGITMQDLVKALPIVVACTIFYANTMDFRESQQKFNEHVLTLIQQNATQIDSMRGVIQNLDNYLSASTGKEFTDGRPNKY